MNFDLILILLSQNWRDLRPGEIRDWIVSETYFKRLESKTILLIRKWRLAWDVDDEKVQAMLRL